MWYHFNGIKGDNKMEFLYEKVYSNQYFALILFATIAVLLVLFGIVLLAAIKDTKKRKLAELDKLEKENINALQEKVGILSNDEEVFGVGQAFIEEAPKKPLEFFTNEDEQSKTRDIVLSAPTTENSMNNLLSQFEDEKKEAPINSLDASIVSNDLPTLENVVSNGQVHKDIVVPEIEVPIPKVQPIASVEPLTPFTPINVESTIYPSIEQSSALENIAINDAEIPAQETIPTKEQFKEEVNTIIEDSDDDFELPAIKEKVANNNFTNFNLEKAIKPSVSKSGIDFGKTGILNFSNIESESYEIK